MIHSASAPKKWSPRQRSNAIHKGTYTMKLEAYAIWDNKAKNFTSPFFMRSRGEAIRAFTSTVNDGSSQIGKFPEDFQLFHVGFYDDNSGVRRQSNICRSRL